MDLQITLTYSGIASRYVATAYPTDAAASEYGASVFEAVDLETASVSSCLRTLLRRRNQAGDQVKQVTFSTQTCEEMERWGLLGEWRLSLESAGIEVTFHGGQNQAGISPQKEPGSRSSNADASGLAAA